MKHKLFHSINFTHFFFFLCMLIGIIARVWQFGIVPGDINQDEAFAGYEAYSLLHYGMDSFGYPFPVYLTTWGSGMNALNTYLMIPFIAVFGLHTWVIRLPQLIVACFTLWVVYLIVKRLVNPQAALCALFLLSISPWHITLSRWGLESNLAPGFLIFGLYFFLRGLDDSKYFMLSALMYGLSLYCYATIWVIVPLIILLQLIYGLILKKITFNRYLLLSGIILGILALPLLFFLLINMDIIKEVHLPFLSIPKLLYMRSGEISFRNIREKWIILWNILKNQTDNLVSNGTDTYGIYYMGTFSFFILGLFFCIKSTIERFIKKEFAPEYFLLIQLGAGTLLGILIYSNINRINILFIPMITIAAIGIYHLCRLIDLRYVVLPVIFYLIMFVGFERYYFTGYRELSDHSFCRGLEDAIKDAISHEGTIYISRGIKHPRILFFTQEPVQEYIDTVEYFNYPSIYLDARSFGRYCFDFNAASPDINATYILNNDVDLIPFEEMGYTLHTYNDFTVAFYSFDTE